MKKVFILGIIGQDGLFFVEFFFQKGYEVYGILCCLFFFNIGWIEYLYFDEWVCDMKQKCIVNLYYGDMIDLSLLICIIQ